MVDKKNKAGNLLVENEKVEDSNQVI